MVVRASRPPRFVSHPLFLILRLPGKAVIDPRPERLRRLGFPLMDKLRPVGNGAPIELRAERPSMLRRTGLFSILNSPAICLRFWNPSRFDNTSLLLTLTPGSGRSPAPAKVRD